MIFIVFGGIFESPRSHTVDFLKNLDAKKIITVPFCLGKVKQPREVPTQKCFNPACIKPAKKYNVFSYANDTIIIML